MGVTETPEMAPLLVLVCRDIVAVLLLFDWRLLLGKGLGVVVVVVTGA